MTLRIAPTSPMMKSAALALAAHGFAVFPVKPRDKRPLLVAAHRPGEPPCSSTCGRQGHGFHDATTDEAIVAEWWDRYPEANIGVATGAVSGFDVLDVDADKDGYASLSKLKTYVGLIPTTVTAKTGGGGLHLLFQHTDGLRLGAGRAKLPDGTALPGLDVRADGGYIVAPPSQHGSGRRYEWFNDFTGPLAAMPSAMRYVLAPPAPPARPRPNLGEPVSERVTDAKVAGILRKMEAAVVGERNHLLHWCACRLYELGDAGRIDLDARLDDLAQAAIGTGLDDYSVRRTIASARNSVAAGRTGVA